jgi:hypothetical protein
MANQRALREELILSKTIRRGLGGSRNHVAAGAPLLCPASKR